MAVWILHALAIGLFAGLSWWGASSGEPVGSPMPDEPKIDPAIIDAPKVVRFCPQCSAKKFHVELEMQGDVVKCIEIECEVCGFDILGAYRTMTRRKKR